MTPKRNTPTKTDLIQLQKLYKTDEKIGERLGSVPAYLVAYWRRKKNVPKYSLPKFSDRDVLTLWERFGDDEKCGLELGISKAAFYNWRRRYNIREKPAFLKLEQLELDFPGVRNAANSHSLYGEQSFAQKILSHAAGKDRATVGSIIKVEPDLVATDFSSEGVISEFLKISQGYVWNAGKIVLTEGASAGPYGAQLVGEFVRRQGIKTVYDLREGHCPQVLIERGHGRPGEMILGTEPAILAAGCLGSLAIIVGPSQAAKLWATGFIEMPVPPTIKIDINGRRARGVYTRDILAYLVEQLGNIDCSNKVIELSGLTVSQMNVSERFTLCYMAQLVGAKAAVTPFNSSIRRYLTGRASPGLTPVLPDKNAIYEQSLTMDVSDVNPLLYTLGKETKVQRVTEVEGQQIRQVVLGGIANGRFEDLRIAAHILKGEKVHRDCKLFVCPASRLVYLEALKKGLIRVFVEAGAIVMNPGGDVSLSRDESLLSKSQPTLSTTINDIKGKQVYYCSPATAAASAINATITDPARYVIK